MRTEVFRLICERNDTTIWKTTKLWRLFCFANSDTKYIMSSKEETYPDVETWCRLCLKEQKDAYTIFDEDDSQLSIPMRLMACLSVEAKSSDGLPKKICGDCRYQLEKSFLFRQRSQTSDKKLRKHIRLVSMGKKSRVFAKAEDNESDEDELEFAESIEFINKLEKQRETVTQKWRELYKEEQEKELISRLETMRDEQRAEVRKELEEEVRDHVRQQLEEEVREQVRQQLEEKVRDNVREQLHDEVQEECRKVQMAKLLGELEVFLSEKKAGNWETVVDQLANTEVRRQSVPASIEVETVRPQPKLKPIKPIIEKRYTRKRPIANTSPVIQQRRRRLKVETPEDEYSLDSAVKADPVSTDDGENDVSAQDTAESVASLQMVTDGDMVTTENGEIYIINASSKAKTTGISSTESQQDNKNITSYNSEYCASQSNSSNDNLSLLTISSSRQWRNIV